MPLWAHLELLHRTAFPCIHEGRQVVFKLPVRGQYGEHVRIGLVKQFDGMGERTVSSVLINLEISYNGSQKDYGGFNKEVTLFLYPTFVQVKHDHISGFVCIGYIRHERRIDGVTPV